MRNANSLAGDVKVILRRRALADLKAIFDYVAKENPVSAHALIADIFNSIEMLQTFPLIGRVGSVKRTRELPVAGTPYVVIYRDRKSTVEIIAVFHGAQKR